MNRYILFRGKRVDNGEWIEGSLIKNIIGHQYFIRKCELFDMVAVEENTISQYIRCCGEESNTSVFEGDIVIFKTFNHYYNFGYIAWENEGFVLLNKNGKKLLPLSEIDYEDWEQAEVIGNIYDNIELLKKD